MKVGILTFHYAYNYGAILQAYATQELVKSIGHEAVIIDYHNKTIEDNYTNRRFKLANFLKSGFKAPLYLLTRYYYWRRRMNYKNFKDNHLSLTKTIADDKENSAFCNYDVILIGSDQLWNKKLTKGFDNVYWGHFTASPGTRVVAWSVCMDYYDLTPQDINYVVNSLDNFYAISVRERSLQQYLYNLTSKNYLQTLDPTLMLSKESWEKICIPVKEQRYIAVYAVQNEVETINFVHEIAKTLRKKVVILRSYSTYHFTSKNKECCGPREFLSYLRYADYIVTTSFHGTVFSILFQKQFVIPVFRENKRIESLLELLGLNERRVMKPRQIDTINSIDYKTITPKLEAAKISTFEYLTQVLEH